MEFLIKSNNPNNIGIGSHFKCSRKMDVANERSVSVTAFNFTGWRAAVITIISQDCCQIICSYSFQVCNGSICKN